MNRIALLSPVLALAVALPAFAADPAHEAQLVVSAAQQIHGTHAGDYSEYAQPTPVIDTAWGPLLAFSGITYRDIRSIKAFGLHLDGIPQQDCESFISDAAPSFNDVWMAGAAADSTGGSVFTAGHLNRSLLKKACQAHDMLGAEFITR